MGTCISTQSTNSSDRSVGNSFPIDYLRKLLLDEIHLDHHTPGYVRNFCHNWINGGENLVNMLKNGIITIDQIKQAIEYNNNIISIFELFSKGCPIYILNRLGYTNKQIIGAVNEYLIRNRSPGMCIYNSRHPDFSMIDTIKNLIDIGCTVIELVNEGVNGMDEFGNYMIRSAMIEYHKERSRIRLSYFDIIKLQKTIKREVYIAMRYKSLLLIELVSMNNNAIRRLNKDVLMIILSYLEEFEYPDVWKMC